ncbi:hypothetical protein SUGI_0238550 [Cryptomeria japonica]|nr:hypothetical protein SUGI_0238550 [Cryptomeria japonica]
MNPVYEIMEFSCLSSLVFLFPTLLFGIIYACSLWSCSTSKSSPKKANNHCHTDSYTTYTQTRICSSAFALFKKRFKALMQRQSHSDKNGKPQSEASELPVLPKPSGPVYMLERRLVQSSTSPSDSCSWTSETPTEKKLLTPLCSNSISVENSRPCFKRSEELCCAVTDGQFQVSNKSRKSRRETVSELTQRVMVYVRVRPLSKKEEEMGARSCVGTVSNKDILLKEIGNKEISSSKRNCSQTYTFDAVFPEDVEQQEVYNTSTAELVDAILHGRNACVFCYGTTGAGKTHTMLGTVKTPGVMAMSIKDVFTKIGQQNCYHEPVVMLSYLEIYNESVKDLLSPGRPLVLREDKQGNVSSLGITQHRAHSTKEVMELLYQGNQNRTTASTRMNETSSRSHAIFQVMVEWKVDGGLSTVTRKGKLSLVDLAGSERAVATDQRTVRSTEGANINKSLLALSSCINALVERKRHIPYRDSKLTQLLKDSLGGTCQTAIIANISPSNLTYSETKNTLHWADRAKEIRTRACINEELEKLEVQIEHSKLLLEMQKEIQQLRMQNDQLQRKLIAVENQRLDSTPSGLSSSRMLPLPSTVHTPRPELSSNGHWTEQHAKEVNIQELNMNLQPFKEESDHLKIESALKEKQLTTHLLSLKREYSLQLKHKDGIIGKLCETAPDLEQRIQSTNFGRINAPLPVIKPLPSLEKPTGKTISASQNDYNGAHSKADQWGRKPSFPNVQLRNPSPSPSVVFTFPASRKKQATLGMHLKYFYRRRSRRTVLV